MDERTYQLKTNEDDIALNTYDDLAQFIRIIDSKNPIEIEKVFEVKSFLRWAAVNQLVGAWDNYLRTGANYYIYNSSTDPKNPKFIWIPWDYDNTFGISYNESDINTAWQVWPIDKWILGPSPKYQRPVIEILLNNPEYRNYYINFAKNFMNKHMSGNQFESRLTQLFNHISSAAYKESDCAECSPFTGRQFSNHIFYQHNVLDQKIQHQNSTVEGIRSFTRARLNYINKNF
jgi:spore coat protein CotH